MSELFFLRLQKEKNNKVCYKLPDWQDKQFKDYIRRYYGYSAYIDAQIGRVLNALTECGFDDNTVVIFTSDHGDMLAAHGFVYKMGNCGYQELAHDLERVTGNDDRRALGKADPQ